MNFTSPSGKVYTWDKPVAATQSDVDAIVNFDITNRLQSNAQLVGAGNKEAEKTYRQAYQEYYAHNPVSTRLADAVTSTLGPNGRNVVYTDGQSVFSTKDGVTVAKNINYLEDPIEELGIKMIKQAAIKTADNAGDGTTTSTLLAQSMVNAGLNHLNNGSNGVFANSICSINSLIRASILVSSPLPSTIVVVSLEIVTERA